MEDLLLAAQIFSYLLVVLTLPLCAYLGVLAILAWDYARRPVVEPKARFAIVIPAHNEQDNIAATVKSLATVDYPELLRQVVVVADNCQDDTATRAREAGATVLERFDDVNKGKGFALAYAFDILLAEAKSDAVVVVDADTIVSPNLLRAFDARISAGELAVQAEYGVSNVLASWRTKLMAIALGMFHRTRSLARERLGVSVGLRGNGMCFSTKLLAEHPHHAFSIVEDVEYGIDIGLAGKRVAFAHEAYVLGEMVSSAQASVSQRQRWEGGRVQLLRKYLSLLLTSAARQKSLLLFDLAMDLMVPPLSYVALLCFAGLGTELTLWLLSYELHASTFLWAMALAGLALYVGRGMQHSGLGAYSIVVMLYAPIYVLWKVFVVRPFGRRGTKDWVRTQRENKAADPEKAEEVN